MKTMSKKDARLDVRLSCEHKDTIDRAARVLGLHLSDFIVSRALAAAANILEEQNRVALSHRDWEQFLTIIGSETEPTSAARQAAERYNEAFGENPAES